MSESLDAYHLALDMIKAAGFTFVVASSKSEACYYSHPARHPLLLRIGMHKQKHELMGLKGRVLAKCTFSPKDPTPWTEGHVRHRLAMAIGLYFLVEPKPIVYHGKRGTWEHQDSPVNLYD